MDPVSETAVGPGGVLCHIRLFLQCAPWLWWYIYLKDWSGGLGRFLYISEKFYNREMKNGSLAFYLALKSKLKTTLKIQSVMRGEKTKHCRPRFLCDNGASF